MFRPFTLRALGGLNENEDPTSLRPNELTEAKNVCRFGLLTGTRPGMGVDAQGEYQTVIEGEPAVQGIFEWSIDRDATREVVVVAGGEIWTGPTVATDQLDKTANSLTITTGANNLWTFADHNDLMYAAGGAAGDSFWYWDGSADPDEIAVQNSAAGTLQPLYVFQWKNYMILSGLQGRTLPDDNPMVWRYHNLGSDPTNPTNWPAANTLGGGGIGGLSGYGSEFSTGTASFQDNNGSYLLLLTNKRIYSYVTDPNALIGFVKNDEIANGCVNQNAYVDLGMDSGDAIYMSEVGIHSLRLSQQYSGRARSFLSWPIRKTFAGLNRNRFKYVSGAYWPNEGIVAFAVSTASSVVNDLVLAMDIQEANEITPDTVRWYKWEIAASTEFDGDVNVLTFGRDSSNTPVMYVGTTNGYVGIFNRTNYSDFGNEYETLFATRHEDFGGPGVDKTIGNLHVVSRGNGDYQPTHQYVLNYGTTIGQASNRLTFPSVGMTWGSGTWGVDTWGGVQKVTRDRFYGYGAAETIAHQFRHTPSTGESEPFFVASITQLVAGAGESASDDVTGDA